MMTERKLKSRSEREQEQPLEKKYKSLGLRHVVGSLDTSRRQQIAGKASAEEKDPTPKQQR